MGCDLTAPSHYLSQCWLVIIDVQWHSVEGNFNWFSQEIPEPSITKFSQKNTYKKFHLNLSGFNELMLPLPPQVYMGQEAMRPTWLRSRPHWPRDVLILQHRGDETCKKHYTDRLGNDLLDSVRTSSKLVLRTFLERVLRPVPRQVLKTIVRVNEIKSSRTSSRLVLKTIYYSTRLQITFVPTGNICHIIYPFQCDRVIE